jgi:hypothetical protein
VRGRRCAAGAGGPPGSGQEHPARDPPRSERLYLTYSLRHSSLLFRKPYILGSGLHENAGNANRNFVLWVDLADSLSPQGAVPGRRRKLIGLDGRVEVDDALRCRCAVDLDSLFGSPFRLRFRAADYDVRSSGMMEHLGRWL